MGKRAGVAVIAHILPSLPRNVRAMPGMRANLRRDKSGLARVAPPIKTRFTLFVSRRHIIIRRDTIGTCNFSVIPCVAGATVSPRWPVERVVAHRWLWNCGKPPQVRHPQFTSNED
ncbi:hypothetical protein Zmor_019501 [Zophobas morio]|uniref:Uncharacterized protein n=1 Tax=Zophobas morio TaxID=2755281 RepID=A0AA38I0L7_9CUCU|nr:hypothetical protein Zmor_019501 [Zophobas morio]